MIEVKVHMGSLCTDVAINLNKSMINAATPHLVQRIVQAHPTDEAVLRCSICLQA